MRIVMMTNTYVPHVGGVARSVESFTAELRNRGHRVLVVAPEYEDMPISEIDVVRIPALQKFNGSDFSVIISTPHYLSVELERFKPELVHSHHPFLIGSTALRIATKYDIPMLFTHHTMYEQYTHYVPGHLSRMKLFAMNLSTGYANLCDHVIAPSQSIAEILKSRGVTVPISSIPTGVDIKKFARGNGREIRKRFDIPKNAKVIGHVGRLAPEKNLKFLAQAVAEMISEMDIETYFFVVGGGASQDEIKRIFQQTGVSDRLHLAGKLENQELIDAYHSMDIFAFASKSETQGMVLVEAMAAGLPVVAIDAPGSREVVQDGRNGILLDHESLAEFRAALRSLILLSPKEIAVMKKSAKRIAEKFSVKVSGEKLESVYEHLLQESVYRRSQTDDTIWTRAVDTLKTEWELLANYTDAATTTLKKKT